MGSRTVTAADTVVAHLDRETQQRILAQLLAVLNQARLFRPRARGTGQPMKVRVSAAGRLGWIGDETGYRYTPTQLNGEPWPDMPEEWVSIYQRVTGTTLIPDSAIINWYDPGASLGFHQDLSEHDLSLPIVTISLGDSASWAIKAHAEDKPSRCIIDSGAVTLLAGPTRLYYHSIERVIAAEMLSPLKRRGRYSITIRVAGRPS
jgi:alkylated DNA repair protein (DNA oxidative demethylase)